MRFMYPTTCRTSISTTCTYVSTETMTTYYVTISATYPRRWKGLDPLEVVSPEGYS